jgi:hypothetical protein
LTSFISVAETSMPAMTSPWFVKITQLNQSIGGAPRTTAVNRRRRGDSSIYNNILVYYAFISMLFRRLAHTPKDVGFSSLNLVLHG